MSTDVTRSTMPPSKAKTWRDHGAEMLAKPLARLRRLQLAAKPG